MTAPTNVTTTTADAATPVTILMESDTFYRWLCEVQDIAEGGTYDAPHLHIEDLNTLESPYSDVEVYLNTSEGTVIARHLRNSDTVKVTMRCEKPGASIMRTVHWMLGEEGVAA